MTLTFSSEKFRSLFRMVTASEEFWPIQSVFGEKPILNEGGCTELTSRLLLAGV